MTCGSVESHQAHASSLDDFSVLFSFCDTICVNLQNETEPFFCSDGFFSFVALLSLVFPLHFPSFLQVSFSFLFPVLCLRDSKCRYFLHFGLAGFWAFREMLIISRVFHDVTCIIFLLFLFSCLLVAIWSNPCTVCLPAALFDARACVHALFLFLIANSSCFVAVQIDGR